jgi:hypothetical protein
MTAFSQPTNDPQGTTDGSLSLAFVGSVPDLSGLTDGPLFTIFSGSLPELMILTDTVVVTLSQSGTNDVVGFTDSGQSYARVGIIAEPFGLNDNVTYTLTTTNLLVLFVNDDMGLEEYADSAAFEWGVQVTDDAGTLDYPTSPSRSYGTADDSGFTDNAQRIVVLGGGIAYALNINDDTGLIDFELIIPVTGASHLVLVAPVSKIRSDYATSIYPSWDAAHSVWKINGVWADGFMSDPNFPSTCQVFLRGGYEHVLDSATATELIAAGYQVLGIAQSGP